MANPTPYDLSYDFSAFATVNPTTPLPGTQVDVQFQALQLTTDEIIDALADVRRSDGALKNGVVTPDSLSAGLVMGFTVKGEWAEGTVYGAADGVSYGTSFYKARFAHTASAETRPDLDTDTWAYLFTFDSIGVGDNSITTAKIGDGAVTEAKIGDGAVTEAKISAAAVATAKIADGAVATAKIADGAVATAKIADSAVASGKLADGAVVEAKIADGAITVGKILDATISVAKLAAAALTSIYSGARSNMLGLANTWIGQQTISTSALDLAVGQMKFPATQNPSSDANTLDDYEEGTFTPSFSASGCTFSYSTRDGTYVKIGKVVHISCVIILNASGNTLTGNILSVTGLPFSMVAPSGNRTKGVVGWFGATSSYITVMSRMAMATPTSVFFAGNTAAATTGVTSLDANDLLGAATSAALTFDLTYFAA